MKEPTCGLMAWLYFNQGWLFLETAIESLIAARTESAAFWWRNKIRRRARNKMKLLYFLEKPWSSRQKSLCVGMRWSLFAIDLLIRA
jgi:hypothetical protein